MFVIFSTCVHFITLKMRNFIWKNGKMVHAERCSNKSLFRTKGFLLFMNRCVIWSCIAASWRNYHWLFGNSMKFGVLLRYRTISKQICLSERLKDLLFNRRCGFNSYRITIHHYESQIMTRINAMLTT